MKNAHVFAVLLTSLCTVSSHCMLRLFQTTRALSVNFNKKSSSFSVHEGFLNKCSNVSTYHLIPSSKLPQRKLYFTNCKTKKSPRTTQSSSAQPVKSKRNETIMYDITKALLYAHAIPTLSGVVFLAIGSAQLGLLVPFVTVMDGEPLYHLLEGLKHTVYGAIILGATRTSATLTMRPYKNRLNADIDSFISRVQKNTKESTPDKN